MTNRLIKLSECGQAVWLDYIHRNLIAAGELKRLIEEDGLKGVTSNPSIFQQAIAGTRDYDDSVREFLHHSPHAEAYRIYERLAIDDIRMAADVLQSVYDRTAGKDGFVSLEVSPYLAHDTGETVTQARHLWQEVGRPNLMIKVPATPEGIPAIETLIAEGININVTLIFSLAQYQAAAYAYLRGVEKCAYRRQVASVASFFVSRVDTVVDRELSKIASPQALSLRGKIAVANSRLAYRKFREIFDGAPFAKLKAQGVKVQRPLWASTSTKNPAYCDVLYVEELIGPDTVNTMPPATLDAFRDHGRVQNTLDDGGEAQRLLEGLGELGIDFNAVTGQLLTDGVRAFADSFTGLLTALEDKRRQLSFQTPSQIDKSRWEPQCSGIVL